MTVTIIIGIYTLVKTKTPLSSNPKTSPDPTFFASSDRFQLAPDFSFNLRLTSPDSLVKATQGLFASPLQIRAITEVSLLERILTRYLLIWALWGVICAPAFSRAALKQPTIRVIAIIAEGIPKSDAKQLIAYAKANNKGGMSNEMYSSIARVTDGIFEGIAIGGDVFPGSTLSDHVLWFNNIPQGPRGVPGVRER
ncbi:hypothetical protein Sjap_003294 [Stephania japonica]|uniref:Uncharacterized protein n=1 Tax=Stephania japonica TaxID=461633 RepID=A0AAP0PVA8_9MAGN